MMCWNEVILPAASISQSFSYVGMCANEGQEFWHSFHFLFARRVQEDMRMGYDLSNLTSLFIKQSDT